MESKNDCGVAGARDRKEVEQDEGEKTEVAGVTGDISVSDSESVLVDEVEADRLRFMGVC